MTILIIAEESAGRHTVELLAKSRHQLSGVLTGTGHSDTCFSGTGPSVVKNPVAAAAVKKGVDILPARRVTDPAFAGWMRRRKIDVLLNVHSLHVIHPDVIGAAGFGAFNLHPGPLPGYAGLNAPSWAIYNGEKQHAVTLHRLTATIDTGDVVYEDVFPIRNSDTGLTVSISCVKRGMPLIARLLEDLEHNPDSLPRRRQDLSRRSYYSRDAIPNRGFIQWEECAARVDAFVRACNYAPFPSPWGHPKTVLEGQVLSILETEQSGLYCDAAPGTVGPATGDKAAIATGDKWVHVSHCIIDRKTVPALSVLSPGTRLSGHPPENRSETG